MEKILEIENLKKKYIKEKDCACYSVQLLLDDSFLILVKKCNYYVNNKEYLKALDYLLSFLITLDDPVIDYSSEQTPQLYALVSYLKDIFNLCENKEEFVNKFLNAYISFSDTFKGIYESLLIDSFFDVKKYQKKIIQIKKDELKQVSRPREKAKLEKEVEDLIRRCSF